MTVSPLRKSVLKQGPGWCPRKPGSISFKIPYVLHLHYLKILVNFFIAFSFEAAKNRKLSS
jgi:hypothetical protein